MYYSEQQAIVNAHMDPKSWEEMEVEEWSKIMSAQAKEDRPVDASEWALKQLALGRTRKEVN